jgi:hypothetical protein
MRVALRRNSFSAEMSKFFRDPGWGNVTAYQRVGISASREVKLLFEGILWPGALEEVDDALQTPTRRHADTPIRRHIPPTRLLQAFLGSGSLAKE